MSRVADYGTLAAFNVAFDMVKRANAGMPPSRPTIADDVHQLREIEVAAPAVAAVEAEERRRRELRAAATDDLYAACRAALRWLPPGAAHDLVVAALEKADGVR